jgi:TLD
MLNSDLAMEQLSRALPDTLNLFQENNFDLVKLPYILNEVSERDGALGAGVVILAAIFFVGTIGSEVLSPLLARLRPVVDGRKLDEIVSGTFLKSASNLRCVYKASRDGWSAVDFHNKVDNLGSAVLACRSRSGATLGGYNPAGWRSTDDYYSSTSAFLWTLAAGKVLKYPILGGGGGNTAIFDYATGGPCFGTSDLQLGPPKAAVLGGFAGPDLENLATNAGDLRQGTSTTAGFSYDTDRRWPLRGSFRIVEVEVYCR